MTMRWLVLLCLWLGGLPAWAGPIAVPPLKERVTDLSAVLSAAGKTAIEAKLAELEQRKGSQLAVLILPSTGEETIEQYGIRVAEAWQLGRKGVDDGILLLVAKDDRALRIEVGYGLEGVIPDAVAKRVIEEVIVPRFKTGDFDGGILAGVDSLIKLVDGEPLPAPAPAARSGSSSGSSFEDALPMVLVFVFVAGGLLRAIFGPLLGATIAGGIAFVGAWFLAGAVSVGLIVALVVFFLTLVGVSRGGGRGGFGGSSGGGFSGGGGGFGGGGASGRW